ncbi:MAG: twin-arginine translocase TatA/TatE family subunit [Candidatus Obscuribacterales bacterium]|jgi:sec-independent protein translocase protein TatA|nr:twin-arginine translocase TatA/TatE family subunit [Candidatus Obscuribacterales bacterium]
MFNVGPGEIMIVGVLALVLFGPKKLPELGKALGQGLGNFKKSLTDAQSELKTALEVEEKQTAQEDSAKPQA